MAINLDKSIQEVKIVLEKLSFNQEIQVAIALDVSISMSSLYRSGVVQELTERLLAIGINMDENQEIDVFTFGENATSIGAVTRQTINGFVDRSIYKSGTGLEGSTYYAKVMQQIKEHFIEEKQGFFTSLFKKKGDKQKPVVVFFITDGDTFDQKDSKRLIQKYSGLPIFWQFVGIGNAHFTFLEDLDNMDGRKVDNANFFNAGDIHKISDHELYSRILHELPDWYQEATKAGIIS